PVGMLQVLLLDARQRARALGAALRGTVNLGGHALTAVGEVRDDVVNVVVGFGRVPDHANVAQLWAPGIVARRCSAQLRDDLVDYVLRHHGSDWKGCERANA